MGLQNPYAPFLDAVEKPARYIGGEKFQIRKNWSQCIGKVALCFPDTYEIGMSHLGFKILYDEINRHPSLLAQRVFAPWIDAEKQIRERDLPLVTLESFKPLYEFDIVGFSLQYEMSYSNILNMLDLGKISVKTKDRAEDEPFVIAGGPCATHPEPLAPFMDFIVIGDGEKLFSQITHFIGEAKSQGWRRDDILLYLANHWDGIYVPKFYETALCDKSGLEYVARVKSEYRGKVPERITRFIVGSLKDYPFPVKSPIPHMTAIFDRFSVELARGCTEGCRFCQAGMIYRPVRERSPVEVSQLVMDGLKNGGFDEASLTCLSTADYSAVTPLVLDLLDKLKQEKATLGISSLRAYGLDERIFDKLAEVKNTSLTFAPEAGSERMRKVINKNVSQEDMLKTARDVFSRGWSKMKLYFMIGLPTETDEDVIEIMECGRKARQEGIKLSVKSPSVTISASSFVPKPHTPFQWASMITLPEIERKQNLLADYARRYKLNFRKHYSKISYLEGIVSRGDRRVGEIIYQAWRKGARFDGWNETFNYDLWIECVNESAINVDYMLGTIPLDGRLPWDHIDVGLEDKFLQREWIKATKNRFSPPCGKVAGMIVHHSDLEKLEKTFDIDKKRLVCYHCGVACDLKAMVEERRDFLQSINAIKHVEYEQPEVLKKDIAKLRDKRGQELGHRYRIEFCKLGSIAYISHTDLQKVVARIFKRADVELLYSEGYKLRPLISFGPALGLGISSLSEYLDVRVPKPWSDTTKILEKLAQASEMGLIFKKVLPIKHQEDSIQKSLKDMTYYFPVLKGDINKSLEELLTQKELVIKSFSKKHKKYIDKNVRSFILDIKPQKLELEPAIFDLIYEVTPALQTQGVLVSTRVENGTGIRPAEIKQCLEAFGLVLEKPIKMGAAIP